MAVAIVSAVLKQLGSVAFKEAREQLRLVAGVDQEVEKLKSNLQAIQAVMVDAEQRQHKEETVRLWLDDLKHAAYDMEDVLDEWITASLKRQIEENALISFLKKVCSCFPAASCFGFKQVFLRHDIAEKIKSINQTLDGIAKRKDTFNLSVSTEKPEWIQTTSFIDVSGVCGRDQEKKILKSKLSCESSEQQKTVQIISMVGMGGIGKTTLAQSAYNDNDVINSFEKRIWVCVSEPFDQIRIAKAILGALSGAISNSNELQELLVKLEESIAGKKFLLVLDDVWIENPKKWEPIYNCLINGGRGSKILVTTRKKPVAQMMESAAKMKSIIVNIEELPEQDCWSLFEQNAFFDRSDANRVKLEEIGRKIVDKCKGLPLAIKTMGSMLRSKSSSEEWESVLESELWHLEEVEREIFRPLLLSYNDLPSKIKQCFSYCAIFQKDYVIQKDELIRLWMAQGYISPKGNKEMEMVGEEYFNYLASRSFFQEFTKDYEGTVRSCKMHDVVHDFAQCLTKNECFTLDSNNPENLCFEKLRHLTLVLKDDYEFPISIIIKAKKLRSLLIIDNRSNLVILRDIFDQLTCLRTLKIGGVIDRKEEIPKEIKELTHLRYLKLQGIWIEKVPEECCELINLQTMEIMSGYDYLSELPQGMGKLVNLRHLILENVWLKYMPKGKEGLICLSTLSKFVGLSRGVDGREACNLDVLKDLNELRLSIRITLIVDVSVDEVKNVELEKMENLVGLRILFQMDLENGAEYEAVCDALRPPQYLESLKIVGYEAKNRWPNWIVSLHKLKELTLYYCEWCEFMPPLGKLPSLEMLRVSLLQRVKRVGDELLGIEERDEEEVHGGTSSSVTAFPKLKQLSFHALFEWEEWDFGKEDIEIMPQLNCLRIRYCGKLMSLPDQLLRSKTLKTLVIEQCDILEERFKKDTGEDWTKISEIPNIQVSRGNFQNLLELFSDV